MKNSRMIAVFICITAMSLFQCKAQNQLDQSILKASNRNMNDGISEVLWMGFLKVCKNTEASIERMSTACQVIYEPGWNARQEVPQTVAESYWTNVKGNTSLKDANKNPFKLKQVRAELEKKENEALATIENYNAPLTPYYHRTRLNANSYDFDKGVFTLAIGEGVRIRGRMEKALIYKGDIENPEKLSWSSTEIKMSEEKASELFAQNSNRNVIIAFLFKDFFEPKTDIGEKTTGVIVSKIQVYDDDTGKLLFTHNL